MPRDPNRTNKLYGYDYGSEDFPTLWELLGVDPPIPPTGQTYGPAGKLASDVMMPGEYFDSTYTHWSDPKLRDWPQPEKMYWGEEKRPDYALWDKDTRDAKLHALSSKYKGHGAVPENLKQSYLDDMLDYYSNTNIQHGLVPEEYTQPRPEEMPAHLSYDDKRTRYVEAPSGEGHTGPDYITMMNIMKAQNDPNFDVGFMGEDYMKRSYDPKEVLYDAEGKKTDLQDYGGRIDDFGWVGPQPRVGGYYSGGDQAIALNPYDMLDFSDPNVDRAFSQGAGKPRTLEDLEGTSLQIGEGTSPWNLNVVSHELGHAYTQYPWNRGKNKFEMPNITSNINMTQGLKDAAVMGTPGHNEAYWIGRAHDDRWRDRDMNLTAAAADNIRNWTSEARNYIDRADQPRSVANAPTPYSFGTPNFAPSHTTPSTPPDRNPRRHHFNEGGIAGLPWGGGQWSSSVIEGDEEIYDIKPLQMDPGIMSIEDLEDLFEEAGLDKRIIYQLINTGGLSQLVA